MKTKRIVVFAICLVASVVLTSCHNNIPCPVYAQGEIAEENITAE